jgi:hypothetical protein
VSPRNSVSTPASGVRPNHAGSYAGHFNSHDIIVEALTITLIVDCGEPEDCCLVAILNDESVLIARADEFDLGPDYVTERAILRALVAHSQKSPGE